MDSLREQVRPAGQVPDRDPNSRIDEKNLRKEKCELPEPDENVFSPLVQSSVVRPTITWGFAASGLVRNGWRRQKFALRLSDCRISLLQRLGWHGLDCASTQINQSVEVWVTRRK